MATQELAQEVKELLASADEPLAILAAAVGTWMSLLGLSSAAEQCLRMWLLEELAGGSVQLLAPCEGGCRLQLMHSSACWLLKRTPARSGSLESAWNASIQAWGQQAVLFGR